MSTARRAAAWLVAHWYLPAVALLGLLAFFAGRRRLSSGTRRTPIADVRREIEVIKAGSKAKIAESERGTSNAIEEVEALNVVTIRKLDEGQARKRDKLRRDPRALSRYLERLGSS